jgi:hypothetical protein
MTSDFCIDVRPDRGAAHETAIAVKYSSDLSDRRTRERLGIEREANLMADRKWSLFTEQTIPKAVLHNLKWLRHKTLPLELVDRALIATFCQQIHDTYHPDLPLQSLLKETCSDLKFECMGGLTLLAVAAWYRYLYIRLDIEITECGPLRLSDRPFDLRAYLLI